MCSSGFPNYKRSDTEKGIKGEANDKSLRTNLPSNTSLRHSTQKAQQSPVEPLYVEANSPLAFVSHHPLILT